MLSVIDVVPYLKPKYFTHVIFFPKNLPVFFLNSQVDEDAKPIFRTVRASAGYPADDPRINHDL